MLIKATKGRGAAFASVGSRRETRGPLSVYEVSLRER
jgi:hypothetical protein